VGLRRYAWAPPPDTLWNVKDSASPIVTPGDVEAFLGEGKVLGLLFSAPWCAAGVLLSREDLATGAVHPLVTVDCDEFPHVADRFQVRTLPTFLLMEGLRERGRLLGAFSAADLRVLLSRPLGDRP
jgi:hypothetical protein